MSEQRWRVRPATRADGAAIRALVAGVLAEYGLALDPAGTVGLYPLDRARVELRKMYFAPAMRGHGLGKALLARALEQARAAGFTRVELETASKLVEAMALYERFGFERQTGGAHAARCDRAYALDLAGWMPPPVPRVFTESSSA